MQISGEEQDGQPPVVKVSAEGDRFIMQNSVRAVLIGGEGAAELEARNAPAHLVAELAESLGLSLSFDEVSEQKKILKAS